MIINLADDAAPLARCRGRSFQQFGLLHTSLLLENLNIQMQEAKEVLAGDAGPILQSGVDDEDSSKTTSGGIFWGFSVQSRSLSS